MNKQEFVKCPMAGEVIEIDNEVRQCRIGEIDPPREYRLVSIDQCAACPIPACAEALKAVDIIKYKLPNHIAEKVDEALKKLEENND